MTAVCTINETTPHYADDVIDGYYVNHLTVNGAATRGGTDWVPLADGKDEMTEDELKAAILAMYNLA